MGEGSRSPHLLCTPPPAMARCVVLCPGSHRPASPPVENLRHLILWSLLPAHPADPRATGEPEDDLTPTPSVISITSHPWDPGSPGRAPAGAEGDDAPLSGPEWSQPAQEDMALRSLEQLPPRTRNSGVWESPKLDKNPEEEASSTEGTGSYKVVRKGKVSWGAPRAHGVFQPAASFPPRLEALCAEACPDPGEGGMLTSCKGFGLRQLGYRVLAPLCNIPVTLGEILKPLWTSVYVMRISLWHKSAANKFLLAFFTALAVLRSGPFLRIFIPGKTRAEGCSWWLQRAARKALMCGTEVGWVWRQSQEEGLQDKAGSRVETGGALVNELGARAAPV